MKISPALCVPALLVAALLSPAHTADRRAQPVCEAGQGYVAIDTASQLSDSFLAKVKEIGIGTVIRYYDWVNETLPGKTLTARELLLIAKVGLAVAVIFQHNNDCLCTFMSRGRGRRDGERALELARSLAQPQGSAVYFGVDGIDAQFLTLLSATGMPAGETQAMRLVERYVDPYFRDIRRVMRGSGYKVGAYGSGLVCSYLLDRQLAEYCWLANAASWPGYERFAASGKWVLKQHLPTRKEDCFGLEVDLNSGEAGGSFGQWQPKPQ